MSFTQRAASIVGIPFLAAFTTLYRLALNIKSTTLILAQGEAGEVIGDSETLLPREILWWVP